MIKILVDSAADCSRTDSVYDFLIPMTVTIDGRDYKDGIDLDADRFYELLTGAKEFPRTSQPSPEDFLQCFEKVKADGDEVICFTISSALSGTYQSACIARQMLGYEGIHIIDTLTATHLIGVLAGYAARRISEGAGAGQIVEECEALKGRIKVLAGLDTLEYLYKGGRLSRTGAVVGELAGIKPVITVTEDGKVSAGSKAIGVPRAIGMILSRLDACELDDRFPIYTLYTSGTENLEKLEQKLTASGYPLAGRRQVGSTIGAHVGPGVYGVLFVVK